MPLSHRVSAALHRYNTGPARKHLGQSLSSNARILGAVAGLILLGAPATAAWSPDPLEGTPVCTTAARKKDLVTTSDGAGGVFVAWTDFRTSVTTNYDIYAQHLNAQ